ncbi:hypothetical protein L1987_64456 [Smallanthus sonchifolius]|uniref:Uncharacterized protein n=1 Tax=Smallanthus sonchifolius TaxID=185202 RepID=A0ACB9CG52_9ASTR|nr:hypothetical protein L1987_64456 [Smallanthus sonchifolius]
MSNHMRTYRGWSSIEDAKLVEALVNMVNVGGFKSDNGVKSDNGFKSGYLLQPQQSLKESPPESEQEQEQEQEQEGDDDFVADMEDNHDEYISISSVQVEETSSARTKKRKDMNKSSSMLKSFNDVVSLFADRLKESSKESSEGIKFEMDLERKKAMITNELSKMTSMTQFERFRAIKR